jgi:amino acid adenylation domain-containing protein
MKSKEDQLLTRSQFSLWTGQKMHPNVPLYNVVHTFRISGTIDKIRFKNAFQDLVNKVEALRTIFYEIDSIPHQHIRDNLAYTLEEIDFSNESNDDVIKDWIQKRSKQHLDITKCVFDSALLIVGEQETIWYFNIHHLVIDVTGTALIYGIMSQLYEDVNHVVVVPSYKDYIALETTHLSNSKKQEIETYWNDKIKDVIAPSLYGRKVSTTTRSERISLKLGKERSKRINEISKRPEIRSWTTDLTLFNIFSSILFIYIYRVSGQKRLSIGAPTHNRATKVLKQTIGLLIEIYPLVTEIDDDDTFITLLNRVKLETNNYLKNCQAGMTTAAINKSFSVILNYINADFSHFSGMPMKSEWIHPGHCDASHQLRCHVYKTDASGEIELFLDLNREVFNQEMVLQAPNHFLKVLDAFLNDMNRPIREAGLLSASEIEHFLPKKEVNNNDESIIKLFEKNALATPDAIALQYKEENISYVTLNKKVNQLARYLESKGVTKEKRVVVYLNRTPEYIISVLAILKTGAAFIPVPSDQPLQRVSFISQDSNCELVISNTILKQKIENSCVEILTIESIHEEVSHLSSNNLKNTIDHSSVAYMMYTSGSTGKPKGVYISHKALLNYLSYCANSYKIDELYIFPLFTSIGFDLTITATFLPLISGGKLVIYKENPIGPDLSLLEVIDNNLVNTIKLTPSHAALLQNKNVSSSNIKTMIVGGEDFKSDVARKVQLLFGGTLRIFNEYGPTEATVGCIVKEFNSEETMTSVPIGVPIKNMRAYVLDSYRNLVPQGVIGELYIAGVGLAIGYANLANLTDSAFIDNPFDEGRKMYRTGDLVRLNTQGDFEYLGRVDDQVKLRGYRIELLDIEANLTNYPLIENSAVVLVENERAAISEQEVINCSECGLPSNYPKIDFDEQGVCHTCNAFRGYKDKAQRYFKTEEELKSILTSKRGQSPHYDCISLLSGGKDSTYILAQLIGMGLKVLAFTLDNGYISDQAKDNIDKVVKKLDVDHIYGTTAYMNKIFVDSLHRHHNVCDGCFKTIYSLSTKIALEKEIPFIVTGLSRGQFFETRLTEELFWDEDLDVTTIDTTILEARKLYHQEEDAVKSLLDTSCFNDNATFENVQFIDFYRYSDVSLEEMLRYLKEKIDWVRPTDTGRSTNCLINQVGIYTHKKQRGYSNYSFPYSWDVRMGHKTREETLEEINEVIDEKEVKRIMKEIGYIEPVESELEQRRLVGYYTGKEKINSQNLVSHLKEKLPEYMIPTHFKYVDKLPLTSNGKVDKSSLKKINFRQLEMESSFVAPKGEIEELLASIWKEVMQLQQVGSRDNFIFLGGHSLEAIRVTARLNEELNTTFPLSKIFEFPTIATYASYLEETLLALLDD